MNRPEDRADDGSTSSPPEILRLDPSVVLYDALKHLYAIAETSPEIIHSCAGTLDEAADALKIAREMGLR